jgi:putative Holliday junction resolvase
MRDTTRAQGQAHKAQDRSSQEPSASLFYGQPAALVAQSAPSESVPTTVLGFDYGARRIGVAVGNRITASARALEVVGNGANGPDFDRIAALLREWRPDALLVGLPLMLDSSEQANSRAARAFADELHARHALAVVMVDERLTSRAAAERFAERRASGTAKRKQAAALDAVAAEIIVEQWLRERI